MQNPKTAVVPFQFENHELRTIIDEQGEPWFVATDVCDVLGIQNTSQAIQVLDEDERSMFNIGRKIGEAHVINESGLYALILRTRDAMKKGTPQHAFRKWVTSEVLPAIRKTGKYEAPQELTITPAQQCALQAAINDKFPARKDKAYAWSRFNNHWKLGSYKQLPARLAEEALDYIAQMDGGSTDTSKELAALDFMARNRFILTIQNGRMALEEIPETAFVLNPEKFAEVVGDPNIFSKRLVPDVINASIKRLLADIPAPPIR